MGQKVHPNGFRTGVYRDWNARWFARGSYGKIAIEDIAIRQYLESALEAAEIARIEIERAGENTKITLHSARPGVVIGKRGQEIDSLRKEISKRLNKSNIEIAVQEVKNPELSATLVARNIASQLVRRVSFKQAMKKAAVTSMKGNARGVKIRCAGRLGGAEIARDEWLRIGSIPLHSLRADVDYGLAEAKTTYGIIGVQVWICRGEFAHQAR